MAQSPIKQVMINTFKAGISEIKDPNNIDSEDLDSFRGMLEIIDDNKIDVLMFLVVEANLLSILNMMVTEYGFDPGYDQEVCKALLYVAIDNDNYDMVEYILRYIDSNIKLSDLSYFNDENHNINFDKNSNVKELLKEHGLFFAKLKYN